MSRDHTPPEAVQECKGEGQPQGPSVPNEPALCFAIDSPVRRGCVATYRHRHFQTFILVVIILNSLVMLLQAARTPGMAEAEFGIETTFTIIFTVEMLIKVVALGFVAHRGAYLRTGWNVLDFIIVLASILAIAGVGKNFSVIRLLRVLRPLRTMSRVEGMKLLMGALFGSIPQIVDNIFLLVFLISIFAILGIQLFAGVLHRRCMVVAYNSTDPFTPMLAQDDSENCGGTHSCSAYPSYPTLQVDCREDTSVFQEVPLNFDNIWRALLLVFKVVSQDDWPDDMGKLMSALSGWTWIFFVTCTVFGAFFGTNLFLAVLISAYYNSRAEVEGNKESAKDECNAPDMLNTELLRVLNEAHANQANHSGHTNHTKRRSAAETDPCPSDPPNQLEDLPDHPLAIPTPRQRRSIADGTQCTTVDLSTARRFSRLISSSMGRASKAEFSPDDDEDLSTVSPTRQAIANLVGHKYFESLVLGATVLNILVLAIDHHKIDKDLDYWLEVANMSCTGLFAIEIILKVIGYGPKRTFRDGYNCFDAFLVAIAIPDLVSGSSSAFTALRAFRMLRALRLVRRWPSIHKLLRMTTSCFREGLYVSLVLLLQIFIFSILGMQFFEGTFPPDERTNFDTLWEAALTCFMVITGESWAGVMKLGMLGTQEWAAVYFLLLFTVGNFVLVNVFIAIILDKMDEEMVDDLSDIQEDDNPDVVQEINDPDEYKAAIQTAALTLEGKGVQDGDESTSQGDAPKSPLDVGAFEEMMHNKGFGVSRTDEAPTKEESNRSFGSGTALMKPRSPPFSPPMSVNHSSTASPK
eukprot:Sspe_Gene.42602::Locus_20697_Transcript_1_1_Confidence_1.000_Length_2533::g.42602::m.42602